MPDCSFPRASRLLSGPDYDRVFKGRPVRVSSKGMVILAEANDTDHPRLGLVVPKKVLKRAVRRNRVKRLVRESFRLHSDGLPNVDIVFLARGGIDELQNAEMTSALHMLWKKISRRSENRQS